MPRTVLMVCAPERFSDAEFTGSRAAIESAGREVKLVSTRTVSAAGMNGTRIYARALSAIESTGHDMLVLIGGFGAPDHLWGDERLCRLVRGIHHSGTPVAAICLAAPVLARAGILCGRRATTYPSQRALAELRRGGATYVPNAVVVDGAVVTASGPEATTAFGEALIRLMDT